MTTLSNKTQRITDQPGRRGSRAASPAPVAGSTQANGRPAVDSLAWGYLIHLGYSMWEDRDAPEMAKRPDRMAKPYLRCDKPLWDEILKQLAAAGGNMVVIDLGDAIRYESHPELAVRHAWTGKRLRRELDKIRKLGLEPIPKLNFSTAHDTWLGPYARMVSTDTYYGVCKDLIEEVIDLFDQPRLFHLGMDEETVGHQRYQSMAIIRQHELWWHDLQFYVDQVEKHNVRAWIWSDYLWHHPEAFFKNMPRSVMQSNWYYGDVFRKQRLYVRAYLDLEDHGYDQIPTGSNWTFPDNMVKTVRYLHSRIDPARLHGFLQAPWHPTLPPHRDHHLHAVQTIRDSRALLQ